MGVSRGEGEDESLNEQKAQKRALNNFAPNDRENERKFCYFLSHKNNFITCTISSTPQ